MCNYRTRRANPMLAQFTAFIRGVDSYPPSLQIALLLGSGIAWVVCGQMREYWSDLNTPSGLASILASLFGFVVLVLMIVVILEAIWLREYSHLVAVAITGIAILVFDGFGTRIRARAVAANRYEHDLRQRQKPLSKTIYPQDEQE